MSKAIFKYDFTVTDAPVVYMPPGALTLSVGKQSTALGQLSMWALVDPTAGTAPYSLRVFGTGNVIPDGIGGYIGTVIDGPYVWHVFHANRSPW